MRLADVIARAELAAPLPAEARAVEIGSLAYDSRDARPGSLYFCVPGMRADGHDFAPAAVQAGAAALVVERPLGVGVPEVQVASARAAMAPAAAALHGDPSASLQVVGVTGTNGKTTTAFLVRDLLEAAGRRCGLLGTVMSVVAGKEHPVERTTPEAIDLQATLAAMRDGGDVACAMEVSSHALELHRADAIHFAAGIFTNLTQDHLDFHPDMEAYFAAKARFFTELQPAAAVIWTDDPYGARLAGDLGAAHTVGTGADAAFQVQDIETGLAGSSFVVRAPDGAVLRLQTPLPGAFNVANAACAAVAARALGVADEAIAAGLAAASRVPGRFEPVEEGQDFAVLVDYAHTPDSLENVLRAARGIAAGRVIAVFGCGGDRDRGKRPLMGEIAARLADVAIVTSDNPRSEDPEAIVAEVMAGTTGGSAQVRAVVDRREAIAAAIGDAAPGDVVVIAGKGHEQGQEFAGGVKVPFDDKAVAREVLRG